MYLQIIALDNLFAAWREFKVGKEKKLDVVKFGLDLEDNIFALHQELKDFSYCHSKYVSFFICDPKLRHIHKAEVRDRVLHHAIMRIIEPLFDRGFIFDSYSSRKNKGTHRAIKKCQKLAWELSRNDTKTVWFLKCDISKFFDSLDHDILIRLISEKIYDKDLLWLLKIIIKSYETVSSGYKSRGIPLGNLTSQLFSNVYLNPLDQFIKRKLGLKCYVRYADDFAIITRDKNLLLDLIPKIEVFLKEKLKLRLHPKKIVVRKWTQRIDFLGYELFPHHLILRPKTKRRILRHIRYNYQLLLNGSLDNELFAQSIQSYLGLLKHCRGNGIRKEIELLIKE